MNANTKTPFVRSAAVAIACATLLGAGCANPDQNGAEDADTMKAPTEMSREDRIKLRQELMDKKKVDAVDEPDEPEAVGDVPGELLDKIMADLEGRTGAPRSEFNIERAKAVQWSDGSLGCPKPGEMYTQAIVPGYQVVLRHGDKSYDYHASERGFFILCAGPKLTR